MEFEVGDIVKGTSGAPYGITTDAMTEGRVINVKENSIKVRVLKHKIGDFMGGAHEVDPKYFEFVRHEEPLTKERVEAILELHRKWLQSEEGGECADLSDADLRGANLRDAVLSGADLSRADLRGADLSDAEGLQSTIDFMGAYFERTDEGYIAYKTFGHYYSSPDKWKIEKGAIIEEVVNFSRTSECGCGINVAPLNWVKSHGGNTTIWKVLIEWPWLAGVCVPYNSDGKIRCERVRIIEKVE